MSKFSPGVQVPLPSTNLNATTRFAATAVKLLPKRRRDGSALRLFIWSNKLKLCRKLVYDGFSNSACFGFGVITWFVEAISNYL